MKNIASQVDLNLLRTFVVVADIGRISVAAPKLNLSQPAVTAQIRKLEQEIGVALFTRSVQGVALTNEGEVLRRDVINILSSIEHALAKTKNRPVSGRLHLACSTTFASYLFPKYFAEFLKLYPDFKLDIASLNTESILEKVRQGKVSLGVVEGLPRASGLRLAPFLRDDLILIGTKKFYQKIKKIEQIKDCKILWRESGSGTRAVIEKALKKLHFSKHDFDFRYEVGSTVAIKHLVMEGVGVAFLPKSSIKRELELDMFRPILESEFVIKREFYWVHSSAGLDGAHQLFKRFVEESLY